MRFHRVLYGCALAAVFCARAASADDGLLARFGKSRVSLATSLGSGTFVTNEFSDDPYVTGELTLEPRFRIASGFDARALFALDCEMTDPDNPTGRRCAPSDVKLALYGSRLWTDPLIGGTVHASLGFYLPASYESRFNHTITNARLAGGYAVELGPIEVGYDLAIQKYLPSRRVRGFTAEDGGASDGGIPLVNARSSAAEDASIGSGGRMNDNWLFLHSIHAGLGFAAGWDLTVSFAIYDYFRYAVSEEFSDPSLLSVGRVQLTSGTVDLSYALDDHLSFSFGVTSLQPALTADNSGLRFPFYDFISPANNYSKWYLSASLAL